MASSATPATAAPEGAGIYDGVTAGSAAALDRFDAAFDAFAPDTALLTGTPARSLAGELHALILALQRIDIDRVVRQQNWWHRFTGADLEARIRLEVAAGRLSADMRRTGAAAMAARHARDAMVRDLPRIDAAQDAHEDLADATTAVLAGSDIADPAVARLHRRLGNLEALHASNRLARAQMVLAIDHLSDLIDRFVDIEQLLFPVWQRHALAVAQSAAPARDTPDLIARLHAAHRHLADALSLQRTPT
jgi:hypothetical protein